jgi:hypothetical protein
MVKNTFEDMRKYCILIILILFILFTGCATYVSDLTTPKRVLQLNETAIFEQDGYQYSAAVDHISVVSSSAGLQGVTVHVTVKNTGTKAFSLVAYPRITDDTGTESPGTSIFLGGLNPGGENSGESRIPITSDEAIQLKDHALLSIRFQNVKTSEATWYVDFNKLP